MADQYTNDQVADIIEKEGLGFAISDYMSGDAIQDPELAEMWSDCRALMHEIRERVAPNSIQSFDEPVVIDYDDDEWADDDDDETDY